MRGLLGGLKRGILAAWGLVLLGILLAPPAEAQDRSIVIEDFDAAIGVSESALVEVTETIRLRFTGEWNGIHRRIPIRYVDARGENYGLRLNLLGVTDEAGKRLEVSRSGQRQEDDLKIWVPGAANAVRTVVIRYTVGRALKFFDDHDELYWNVTGDQWPYPIGTARAQYHLRQVFVFMNGLVLNRPEVMISGAPGKFDAEGRLTDPPTRDFVAKLLVALGDHIRRLAR